MSAMGHSANQKYPFARGNFIVTKVYIDVIIYFASEMPRDV
jgi:hypothetical protein